MGLRYRDDPDLAFLQQASHEDLEALARCLTHDEKNEKRWAQELLDDPAYRDNQKDLRKAWQSIAAELQSFGGDSFVNLVRRTGVTYREIVTDVCKRLDVVVTAEGGIADLETQLMDELLKRLSGAGEADRAPLQDAVSAQAGSARRLTMDEVRELLRTDRKIALLVAQALAGAVSQVLLRAAAASVTTVVAGRAAAALVPGLGLVMAPTLVSIATGPAYRVTTCAVLQVAQMRQQSLQNDHYQ